MHCSTSMEMSNHMIETNFWIRLFNPQVGLLITSMELNLIFLIFLFLKGTSLSTTCVCN